MTLLFPIRISFKRFFFFGKGGNPEVLGVLCLGFSRPQIHYGLFQEEPKDVLGMLEELHIRFIFSQTPRLRGLPGPAFPQNQADTHGYCCLISRQEITELRAQKAKWNHFKPSAGEPSLPGCSLFVTPLLLEYYLVTLRRDVVEQWVDFSISVFADLLVHGISGAADSCSTEGFGGHWLVKNSQPP